MAYYRKFYSRKFVTIVFAGCMFCTNLFGVESALVYPGSNGKLVYEPHANQGELNNDNFIPDFSYVGYKEGAVALPIGPENVPVKAVVEPGSGNDRQAIQDAINAVCEMPLDANGFRGAVLIKAGNYEVSDSYSYSGSTYGIGSGGECLRVWASGVVIRGEGQGVDGTVITSEYSSRHDILSIGPRNGWKQEVQWIRAMNPAIQITDDYVGTGTNRFSVADASGFSVGEKIFVLFTPNQTWIDDIHANDFMESTSRSWEVGMWQTMDISKGSPNDHLTTVWYERYITAINGNTITVQSPIVQPLQTKYGGGEVREWGSESGYRLDNVGVEDIRFVGRPSSTKGNSAKNAIKIRDTENAWIHGVTGVLIEYGTVSLYNSHYVTIEECAYINPPDVTVAGTRYCFQLEAESSHNLFQRCYAQQGRHDFVVQARIPGPNAFVDCLSEDGIAGLGPHHRWATGTLFDNIKSTTSQMALAEHRGDGGSGHGWAAAQTVGWNCDTPTITCDTPVGAMSYAIGCKGTIVDGVERNEYEGIYPAYYESQEAHVATRSLYLKQLEDRLGAQAVSRIASAEQLSGTIWDQLSSWAGSEPLIGSDNPVTGGDPTPTNGYEAEAFTVQSGCVVSTNQVGFTGDGFVDMGGAGTYFELANVAKEGVGTITVRYALASGSSPCELFVDGQSVGTFTMNATGGLEIWGTESLSVTLSAGTHTLKLVAGANGGPNADHFVIDVTPSNPPTLPTPENGYEAETYSALSGCVVTNNRAGFTGDGFVDMGGAGTYFEVSNIAKEGEGTIAVRYALGSGSRSCELFADGQSVGTFVMNATGGWTTWTNETLSVTLSAGTHTFKLVAGANGGPNVDHFIVDVTPDTPVSSTDYEAELYTSESGCSVQSTKLGYSGTGYADMGGAGTWFELTNINGEGASEISVTYALDGASRPCELFVDGQSVGVFAMNTTGGWETWTNETLSVTLSAGSHVFKLVAGASGGPNVDYFTVATSAAPPLTPIRRLRAGSAGAGFADMIQLSVEMSAGASTADYWPVVSDSLVATNWVPVAHSDAPSGSFVVTNLNLAGGNATNKVIYIRTTDNAGFFMIHGN